MAQSKSDEQFQLVKQLQQAGDFAAAERICHELLAVAPDDPVAIALLGASLSSAKKWNEAIAVYSRGIVILPDSHEIRNNLGVALAARGYADAAVSEYRRALQIAPNFLDAMINLGAALSASGQLVEAIASYQEVLRHQPDRAAAFNNLGVALAALKRFEEAVQAYQQAIAVQPDYADAYSNLGVAYFELHREQDAHDAYRWAIVRDPAHATAINNLGNLFLADGQVDEAIAAFKESLRLRPDFVDAKVNLGMALMEDGAYDQAAKTYADAAKIAPSAVEPRWHLACHLLLHGEFDRGWIEYEWRWLSKASSMRRITYPRPTWAGEDLSGRTILIYTEQGFGDCIQFIRYVTLVARRGGRVILHCPPALARLMAGVEGVAEIYTGEQLPAFDVYCPLITLPLVFQTRLQTVPADVPYIAVHASLATTWRDKVAAAMPTGRQGKPALKVGIVWAGGAMFAHDRKRSVTLGQLSPLAKTSGVIFFSLQKGAAANEAAQDSAGLSLIDFTADLQDFADTAALISQLDLVISVDTAVAHLAGALGKPVWLLLRKNPDWRWMLDRDDSPWYPTMRLFRQTTRGQWADVIARMAAALNALCSADAQSAEVRPLASDAPRRLSTGDAIALAFEHQQSGRLVEAGGIYRQILAQQPDNTDVLHLMGLAALEAHRPESAVEYIARAVGLAPRIAGYQQSLGRALAACGKWEHAIAVYDAAIGLDATLPDIRFNLANAYLNMRRFDEAAVEFRAAIAARPEHADAHINLGGTLVAQSRFDEAIVSFEEALRLNPEHGQTRMNLAMAMVEQRRFRESEAVLRQWIKLEPASADAHWLLARLALLRGEFAVGWIEHEWRLRRDADISSQDLFAERRWDGGNLNGRTILLRGEQGLGDMIQFARYAPLVASRGGRVVLQCPQSLARIFKSIAGVADVITDGANSKWDVQAPLMSLPLLMHTRVDNIPANVPYLGVEPAERKKWNPKIITANMPMLSLSSPQKLEGVVRQRRAARIGLVWAGSAAFKDDSKRSMALSEFISLNSVGNVEFFSLQKGPAASQVATFGQGLRLTDLTADLHDFSDTAALILNLDLVISVDTAVAHLAGALGKRVWVLLPYTPDWRWMLDRETSPWYSTMRLFRQTSRGDWKSVIARVIEQLADPNWQHDSGPKNEEIVVTRTPQWKNNSPFRG